MEEGNCNQTEWYYIVFYLVQYNYFTKSLPKSFQRITMMSANGQTSNKLKTIPIFLCHSSFHKIRREKKDFHHFPSGHLKSQYIKHD